MNASAKDTVHEDTYNTDYAWMMARMLFPDLLTPSGVVVAEDIRHAWCCFEKLTQWLSDWKVSSNFLFIISLLLIRF
jgi:hypothetical protein